MDRAVHAEIHSFNGDPEKYRGEELQKPDFENLLLGNSLFAEKRLILISELSSNKVLFEQIPNYLDELLNDSSRLVMLIEDKVDRRSKVYKALMAAGVVQEFNNLNSRNMVTVTKWVRDELNLQGLALSENLIQELIAWVGVSQWDLESAIFKLKLSGQEVTERLIKELVEPSAEQNVFEVFSLVLEKNRQKLSKAIKNMKTNQDPYKFFGLISGQVFNLAALVMSSKPAEAVASDLGVHPYSLRALSRVSTRISKAEIRAVIKRFAKTDLDIKSSRIDPWLLIENLLYDTQNRVGN